LRSVSQSGDVYDTRVVFHPLRRHKAAWEEEVQIAAARAVVGLSKVSGANWDYINLQRIFRLADTLQINLQNLPKFDELQHLQMISQEGDISDSAIIRAKGRPSLYLCGLAEGRYLYQYTSGILTRILEKLGVQDISDATSPNDIRALTEEGIVVFVQAPFWFKNMSKARAGPDRERFGHTRVGGVTIRFVFDAWESTSMTACNSRLSGRRVESVVGIVSSRDLKARPPSLQISCLGIGSFFEQIHWRSLYQGQSPADLTKMTKSIYKLAARTQRSAVSTKR